ncbi:hypothetical protein [Povalibacter sp.]|uniref:hypothetical protein n=1 Tax=Povalibacter sp. TaxID=1962978 RepID=UPI002F42710E
MFHPICVTCGTQYETTQPTPERCPICCDDRQYVGWDGQQWTTMGALAHEYSNRLEDDGGLFCVGMSPSFAIDQRAMVLPTASHRILWECTPLVTAAAVDAIQARGGIDLIAISHPHFYSSMVEWSTALGGVPVYLHESDRHWIGRSSPLICFWNGDKLQLSDGVTLLRCGGHFPGSTALHWQDALRPRGQLFAGDALQVVLDRKHVTFMYSYPNYIPMPPQAVLHIRTLLERYAFDDLFGYTWGRNILGGARDAVNRSLERYFAVIGSPA